MPFFTASQDVQTILLAGGLSYATSLIAAGHPIHRVMQLLQARYTPMGGVPYASQVYQAIVGRANAALNSGAALNRRPAAGSILHGTHTGTVGIPDEYRYSVMVDFVDGLTGKKYRRMYLVDSATILSRQDVLNAARVQALSYLQGNVDTLPGAAERQDYLGGQMRITEALTRV